MSVSDLVAKRMDIQRQILINPTDVDAHKALNYIQQQVNTYMYVQHTYVHCTCMQWDLSIEDTLETALLVRCPHNGDLSIEDTLETGKSVLISEVSSFQR